MPISRLKDRLGSLPFADLIKDKSWPRMVREVDNEGLALSQVGDTQDNSRANGRRKGDLSSYEPEADDFPELGIIKKKKDVGGLAKWDKETISKLQVSLLSNFDTVNPARHAPAELVEAVMFVDSFHRGQVWRPGEDVDVISLKRALQSSLKFLKAYPDFENLAQLFPVVYFNSQKRNGNS